MIHFQNFYMLILNTFLCKFQFNQIIHISIGPTYIEPKVPTSLHLQKKGFFNCLNTSTHIVTVQPRLLKDVILSLYNISILYLSLNVKFSMSNQICYKL